MIIGRNADSDVDHPFLQGRALVFASRFARLLPVDTARQYLDAAVQVLESPSTGVPFKICAVKAIQQYVVSLRAFNVVRAFNANEYQVQQCAGEPRA